MQYLQIPPDLGEWELGTYFTFTQHDLEIIQVGRAANEGGRYPPGYE
ncbi:hypothetical protein HQN89_24155 [Paenibacillus frigoriresistens]|nr:hypothetical protein [Paenibacillus frigoriresistens]NRF94025.1 hypothetical protein [Paenibacillus frigoriresistens]